MSLAGAEILLAFKAGRAFRREGTNIVEPSPAKGAIYLTNGDDGLLHFIWKNRTTGDIEEDLILLPFDVSFVKVSQSPGRVYVLKFSSSNQRHFFWLQDSSTARDADFIENVNGLLQNPDYDLRWGIPIVHVAPQASTSAAASAQPATSSNNTTQAAGPGFAATPEQLTALSQALSSISGRTGAQGTPDVSLSDILTPANLSPLFTSHPELIPTLFPHLPPDLPIPPSADVLQRIIHSPQFRASVANFDQALRTGLLGGLVQTLGLPAEAGTGVDAFLRAIQEQADRENNSMDTD